MSEPQTMSSTLAWLLTTLGGAVIGFFAAVFTEPVRRWIFRPVISLSFDQSKDCIAHTPIRDRANVTSGIYFRVRIINEKSNIAKQCRAYLVNVEKLNDQGVFERTIYTDSIQLAWSCREGEEWKPVDLPKGVTQYIDVISTQRNALNTFKLKVNFFPLRYHELLTEDEKTLRLTVQVAGDGFDPKLIKLKFNWNGQWNNAHMHAE